MSKTQYFVAATLDGFIADAEGRLEWLFQFNDAEGVAANYEQFLSQIGAVAMGAATYEFLLKEGIEKWPYLGMTTWVFTHRELKGFEGADIRFTTEDVGVVHEQMVRAAGEKNVWLVGGGNLVAQFAARGLVDELHLSLAPVVLGKGVPLLPTTLPGPLELQALTRFGKGLVELRYAIPKKAASSVP